MRLALAMLAVFALASCSAATGKPSAVAEADQTASEMRILRREGMCFDDQSGTNNTVRRVMDFWLISFGANEELQGVTAAVSWNPDIEDKLDTRAFRAKMVSDSVIQVVGDDLLAVPKNYEIPYIHFFGGTAEGRRAAAKLVTFCKP